MQSTPPDPPPVTQPPEAVHSLLDRPLFIPLGWIILILILLFEWGLFVHFVQREILWGYPMSFDQITYLERSYETFDRMLTQGPLHGFMYGLQMPVSQGVLLHPQAALLFLLLGPSRLTALTLNFVYFAIFQSFLVYTLRWATNRWSVAFYGLGLLLAAISWYQQAGSLTDFRIDFIAACLFGTFICLAIRSNLFASWPWSLGTTLVAALLILFRFLTAPAVVIIGFVMLFALVLRLSRERHDTISQEQTRMRIRRLIVCGGLVGILIAPAIWLDRGAILNYYGSQITSHENKYRDLQFGVTGTLDSLLFYPRSLSQDHLGRIFWYACVLTLLLGAAVRIRNGRKPGEIRKPSLSNQNEAAFFVFFCLMAPLLVLTSFPSRSPVVGSILVPPLIGVVLIINLALAERSRWRDSKGRASRDITWALALIALCAGAYVNLSLVSRRSLLSEHSADVKKIGQLYEQIGQRSVKLGWMNPRIAMDRIHDYLYPTMLAPVFYEREGVLLKASGNLGMTVMPATEEAAVRAIEEADFAVLTEPGSIEQELSIPFNQSMKVIEDRLLRAADQNLLLLERINVFSQKLALYMRQPLRIEGASGDWITSDGATLVGPAELLRAKPKVEISGRTILFDLYHNKWSVRAQLLVSGQAAKEIFATITPPADHYTIELRLDPESLPANGDVQIHFGLDGFFVPKDAHINDDTRHLSIMKPQRIFAFAN